MNSICLEGQPKARLASPFGGRQLITRKVAAALLGVDIRTLVLMRDRRIIPGVEIARGEVRFSEADIRAYLDRTVATSSSEMSNEQMSKDMSSAPESR